MFQVIWRRASDPNPISIGEFLFSTISRYSISFSRETGEYNLTIQDVVASDEGEYECKVGSDNKDTKHVLLKVHGESAVWGLFHKSNKRYIRIS